MPLLEGFIDIDQATELFSNAQDAQSALWLTTRTPEDGITHNGIQWIRPLNYEEAIRERRSFVWVASNGELLVRADGRSGTRWRCIRCKAKRHHGEYHVTGSSTSNQVAHLRLKHKVEPPSNATEEAPAIQIPTPTVLDLQKQAATSISDPASIIAFTSKYTKAQLQHFLITWITVNHVAFHAIEHQTFVNLLSSLNPSVTSILPSANTLRQWTIGRFQEHKQLVTKLL